MPDEKEKGAAKASKTNGGRKYDRNPTYIVFRHQEDGALVRLNEEPIAATDRRKAIIQATDSDANKEGTFTVIPAGSVRTITRTTENRPVDTFV